MTKQQLTARIDELIDLEYQAIGGDAFREQFGEEAVNRKIIPAYTARLTAELERDPEFKTAWYHDLARQDVQYWEVGRRPEGAYRPDGVLKLSNDLRVFMPEATREHLLSWALCENDDRNLAYIKIRLDAWDDHPECKNLDQLERAVFGWRPES